MAKNQGDSSMEKPPLHQEAVTLLNLLKEKKMKPYYELSVEEARARNLASAKITSGTYEAYRGKREEVFIPSTDVKDGVPVYVYQPANIKSDPTIYVYFHGGGLVVGSRETVDVMCKMLVDDADGTLIIVNVEYRLAPEHKAPAAMDDALCVVGWVQEHKNRLGGSERSKVGLGGDSGGGTIAASAAHDSTDLSFQILIYPHVFGKGCTLPSAQKYSDGPLVGSKLSEWVEDLYIPKGEEENPRIAPIYRQRFEHLPPCLFIAAEVDPLIDESYEYGKKLTTAGVPNELMLVKGAIHTFYTAPAAFKELTKEPYAKTLGFIRRYGTAEPRN